MTDNSAGFPRAAEVSPRLQVADAVDSTNAKLILDAAADPAGHPHLSVLLTRDQRAGRGRLDRTWTTPPGTALAISVLLRVGAVADADRGWIPLLAGLAMADAIGAQLPGRGVAVKWPNDVLVERDDAAGAVGPRKISGILAEVAPFDPHIVVVGAGVNTTMASEELPVPSATSFADQGATADEDRLIADYLLALRDGIAALAVAGHAAVVDQITARCSTIGRSVDISLPDGTVLHGRAVRLDSAGRLVVDSDGVESVVGAGDVVHVR